MHPLDGARAKLARAAESLLALERDATSYLSGTPPPIRLEMERRDGGRELSFVAYGEPQPPLRFSVITGEIIHHLRSSLDHVIHSLLVHRGVKPTIHHQFPICTTEKAFKEAINRTRIKGVGPTAKKKIQSVQPFTTPHPDDTVLHVVSEYNNIDKHRLLVVLGAVADIGREITIGTDQAIAESPERKGKGVNIVGFGEIGPKKVTREGIVVFSIRTAEAAPELTAEALLMPQLVLEKCGRVKLAPLGSTLRGIVAGVRNTVELFADEFS